MADDVKVVGLASSKKKDVNWKVVGAMIGVFVLAIGVIAGIFLVRQSQDIEEKAACVAACPRSDGILVNCYGDVDPDGDELACSVAGRVAVCGQNASSARQYCCPTAGGSWTTNMTLCSVATATGTATATATATATGTSTSATKTATPTATSTSSGNKTATPTATSAGSGISTPTTVSSGTPFPVPETGANWTTVLGAGAGIIMILLALGLAL